MGLWHNKHFVKEQESVSEQLEFTSSKIGAAYLITTRFCHSPVSGRVLS